MAKRSVDFDMAAKLSYINIYDSKSGTDVLAHPLAFDNNDFQNNLTKARILANVKEIEIQKIEILPEINLNNTPTPDMVRARNKLLPGAKGANIPDYRISGKYIDLKEPTGQKPGKETIRNLMSEARSQSDGMVIIINSDEYISETNLFKEMQTKYFYEKYEGFTTYLKLGVKNGKYLRDSHS